MPQFYLAGDWAQSKLPKLQVPIDGDLAHHLRVRRIGPDDVFTVFDGQGYTATGRLSKINDIHSQIEIEQIQEVGTHGIFICRIEAIQQGKDQTGLVYFNREYHAVNKIMNGITN